MMTVAPTSGLAANPGDTNNLTWTFNSGSQAFDYLNSGQSLILTYTVQSGDGLASDTQQVVITINGTADGILGTNGDDSLTGTAGNDQIFGLDGKDTITGGQGNDQLEGGDGSDVYRFNLTDGNDTIFDSSGGQDEINILSSGAALSTLNFERLDSDGDLAADDMRILYNGQQLDILNHYAGNDVEMILFSGGGTFLGYQLGTVYFNLSDDASGVLGGTGQEDVIASASVGETLTGGGGNDLLFGNGSGDTIDGGAGSDLILGGAGNDILVGGGDRDWLNGGSGSDTFEFNNVNESPTLALADVITDFAAGDKIDLVDIDAVAGGGDQAFLFGGNNVNTVANSVTWHESGGNTIVHLDVNGDTTADMQIILNGITLGLNASSFNL
jgi:Ca2+-binding RTX toxin-like protein